ncbi:uncharacterized protein METZ01_LOCUS179476, partial [marine metagenome]
MATHAGPQLKSIVWEYNGTSRFTKSHSGSGQIIFA